jgi:ABC-type phosphate transport system substrate-binding protein
MTKVLFFSVNARKRSFYTLLVLLFLSLGAYAQSSTNKQETIYISSAKFSSPLVEKWIAEYTKANPDIRIRPADTNNRNVDLSFVANNESDSVVYASGKTIAYVGRYALLPVTTKDNPVYEQISKKKLGKKEIKNLFFIEDALWEEENSKKNKLQNLITVYSGSGSTSGAVTFASHFGFAPSNLRGKKISGDDIYLLNAIQKDSTGVTFNNLSYIYDLKDRRLKDEIALLPLDVKKEQLEVINSENIDQTLSLLEEQNIELIPVQSIGFAYSKQERKSVKDFLQWVITDGQKFNHEYGFLNLDKKTLAHQKEEIGHQLLTYTK